MAGAHLLIEKPLSINLDGVDALKALVAQKKVVAGVAYTLRAQPALQELQQAIASGKYGKPLQLTTVSGQDFAFYRPAYASTYYAKHASGGGAVQDALTHVLNAAQWLIGPAVRVVADAAHLKIPDVVAAPRQVLKESGVTLWRDALAEKRAPFPHLAGPDDLCVMPYTSGTTGKPKGCMHTHRTVMSTTVAGGAWVDMQPESVILCSMPLFHVTGMQCSMNQPIYFGGTIVLMTRWDRDTAGALIQRHKVEGWTNIATMAIDFLSVLTLKASFEAVPRP